MALSEELKKQIQLVYSEWLESNKCKPRRPQREMIAHIARCLGNIELDEEGNRVETFQDQLCVVQAGTGTGKTLAYMIATIAIAKLLDKKVVISTATVALQEQLLNKDLPNLNDSSSLDFSYAIAKGRSRYLCLSKLQLREKEAEGLGPPQGLFPDEQSLMGSAAKKSIVLLAKEVGKAAWDGELDSVPDGFDAENWSLVSADRNSCSGKQCSNYRNCYLFNARDEVRKADVIVANHDLVLADLTSGGGNVLPVPEETIYVFDEAHHLPEKSRNHLSVSMGLSAQRKHLSETKKLFTKLKDIQGAAQKLLFHEQPLQQIDDAALQGLDALEPTLTELYLNAEVSGWRGDAAAEKIYRFKNGEVPVSIREAFADLQSCFEEKQRKLGVLSTELAECLKEVEDGPNGMSSIEASQAKKKPKSALSTKERLEAAFSFVGGLLAQSEHAQSVCESYAEANKEIPYARWLQATERDVASSVDLNVYSVPLSTANILRRILWGRCFASILTSATLAPAGEFKHFFSKLGYGDASQAIQLFGEFDYQGSVFHVPAMESLPTNSMVHTEEIIDLIPKLLSKKAGSLVLFSSRRQMEDVASALADSLDVLVQGARSKQHLLDAHRAKIDAGEPSVLFGLASFAEGLDLPGAYCEEVIIAKLPFAVPDGPVDQAMGEWIESKGGSSFRDISLPDAALRLMQASGRLLRSEADSGRISLLDRRIVEKSYGRQLLEALPPFSRDIRSAS